MDRRSFLARLTAGAAITAGAIPTLDAQITTVIPDLIVVDGVEARWLGWRQQPHSDVEYGVWIFFAPAGRRWHSTNYGYVGEYRPGHLFNLTKRDDHPWIQAETDDDVRHMERARAYHAGRQFLADHPELLTPPSDTLLY